MELKGVSFVVATLLLHELDPSNIPYFTVRKSSAALRIAVTDKRQEALYRWVREVEAKDGTWDRRIEYNLKHYKILLDKTAQLRGRLRSDSGVDVSTLEVEHVARELNSWANLRRKRNRNEEDDFLLKPLEKQAYKRLGPPKVDERERQAVAPRAVVNTNPDESTVDSATPPTATSASPPNPSASLPKVPPAVPYLKPGFKSTWPGHLRTACEYCRKAKRACKHKDDPLNAPPLKAIGRPRKYPLPEGGTPQPAASRATAANHDSATSPTQYMTIPAPQDTPTTPATPAMASQQPISSPTNVPVSDPISPAFQLSDPHAAMRDALVAFQRNS